MSGRCVKHDNWHPHCQRCCYEENDTLRAELAAAKAERDNAHHVLGEIDCALNPPNGGNYTQQQVLSLIRGLRGDAKHCAEVVQQVTELRRELAATKQDRDAWQQRAVDSAQSALAARLRAEVKRLRSAAVLAREAIRKSLVRFDYKDEPALLEGFDGLGAALKPRRARAKR